MSFDSQQSPSPTEFTTCSVSFNSGGKNSRQYTYKVLRALALQAGDQAVVTVKGKGLSLVHVHEVHDSAKLDPEAKYEYQWIQAKGGQDVIDQMQAAQIAAKKAAMLEASPDQADGQPR